MKPSFVHISTKLESRQVKPSFAHISTKLKSRQVKYSCIERIIGSIVLLIALWFVILLLPPLFVVFGLEMAPSVFSSVLIPSKLPYLQKFKDSVSGAQPLISSDVYPLRDSQYHLALPEKLTVLRMNKANPLNVSMLTYFEVYPSANSSTIRSLTSAEVEIRALQGEHGKGYYVRDSHTYPRSRVLTQGGYYKYQHNYQDPCVVSTVVV